MVSLTLASIREKSNSYISIYALAEWIRQLRQEIDHHKLVALFINYICLKGAMYIFVQNTMLAVYKQHGLEGTLYQIHYTVVISPWAMKGIIGTTSDLISIKGFKKRWYLIMVSVVGTLSSICLFLSSFLGIFEWSIVPFLPLPFFLIHCQIATCDLLCEGQYAKIMRETNVGTRLVSFVWMAVQTGSLFGTISTGWLIDVFGTKFCFLIMIFLSAVPLYPWLMNFFAEEIISSDLFAFDYLMWFERRRWFTFALLMTLFAAGQILISMTMVSSTLLCYVFVSTCICCTLQFRCLPPALAKVNLFMFAANALYVNLQGAMDYWYTANPHCVPNGPNFSFSYYQTIGQSVGVIASLFGLWIFQSFLKEARFRTVFFLATSLKCIASITDYVILMRWNLNAGIPDRVLYLLGDSIIYPIVSMMSHMPAVILTCKLCPKNVESTAYALLCAFGNYGSVVSRAIGVYLLDTFNVHLKDSKTTTGLDLTNEVSTDASCTYSYLPMLIVIGHCILPMLTIVLNMLLIPEGRLCDDLDHLVAKTDNHDVEMGADLTPLSEGKMVYVDLEP